MLGVIVFIIIATEEMCQSSCLFCFATLISSANHNLMQVKGADGGNVIII